MLLGKADFNLVQSNTVVLVITMYAKFARRFGHARQTLKIYVKEVWFRRTFCPARVNQGQSSAN